MTDSPGYATLSDDKERIEIYPETETAKTWKTEADNNDQSLSQYLQTLIHEARIYRKEGLLTAEGDQQRLKELQEEVENLETRLQEKESESSAAVSFDHDTLREFLTGNYQSLDEILQNIVESGVMDDALRQPVENQLYFLAAQDEVEFERGWGWKLTDENGGDS